MGLKPLALWEEDPVALTEARRVPLTDPLLCPVADSELSPVEDPLLLEDTDPDPDPDWLALCRPLRVKGLAVTDSDPLDPPDPDP